MSTRRVLLCGALLAVCLLVAAPVYAEDEGDYEGGDDYEGGGEDYGGEDYGGGYGGGGYGDYGDYGGGMGGGPGPSDTIKGVLDLDEFTFFKVIDGTRPAFVEFYSSEDEGSKDFMAEYETLAEEMGPHPDLILAKIDAEEATEVAAKYGVKSYPTVLYFAKGAAEPEVYEDVLEADEVKEFLTERVGEVGQLSALMPFVEKFLDPANKAKREAIVTETEAEVAKLMSAEAIYGKWYVKIMKNVNKKGDDYVNNEFSRLLRMVYDEAESLKEEKVAEFRTRIAVLKAFNPKLKELEALKKNEVKDFEDEEGDEAVDDAHEEL